MALAPQINFLSTPASICNMALDSLGQPGKIIGDISDGTPVAETARRNYGRQLRNLLRAAHWVFARKAATLQLLGDATGQSAAPVSTFVETPWTYAYGWPIDAVQGRFMPANTPLSTYGAATTNPIPPTGGPIQPSGGLARFLVTSSDQYPTETGQVDWPNLPDFRRTEGVGPTSRKVILTNMPNALFVYTRLVTTIEEWDALFRQAMVASMAVILAPVAIEDPKLRVMERDRHIKMMLDTLTEARVASANEVGFAQTVNHTPGWLTARNQGGWGWGWGASGMGGWGGGSWGTDYYCGWDSYGLGGGVY